MSRNKKKAPTVTPSLDPGFLTNPPEEHSREIKRKGMCATGDRHGDIQYKRREGGALSSTAVSRRAFFFSLYGRVVLGSQTAPPFVRLAGM